jgi:hypothetical protein
MRLEDEGDRVILIGGEEEKLAICCKVSEIELALGIAGAD